MHLPKLVLFIFLFLLMLEVAEASDAIIAYRSNTGSCASNVLNCPKIRIWNSTVNGTWGSEVELETAGSPVREAVVKYSNLSSKAVLVTLSDDGNLDAYVCMTGCQSASAWTVTNNIGMSGAQLQLSEDLM